MFQIRFKSLFISKYFICEDLKMAKVYAIDTEDNSSNEINVFQDTLEETSSIQALPSGVGTVVEQPE